MPEGLWAALGVLGTRGAVVALSLPQPSQSLQPKWQEEEREGFLGGRWCLLRRRNLRHQLGAWNAKEPPAGVGSEGWAVPRAVFAAFFTLEVTAGLGVSAWGCHCPHWGSQLPVPGGDAGMQLQWQSHGSSASAWELQELSADPSVPALF